MRHRKCEHCGKLGPTWRAGKQDLCAVDWRVKLGFVDPELKPACAACKRGKRPCGRHGERIPLSSDTLDREIELALRKYEGP